MNSLHSSYAQSLPEPLETKAKELTKKYVWHREACREVVMSGLPDEVIHQILGQTVVAPRLIIQAMEPYNAKAASNLQEYSEILNRTITKIRNEEYGSACIPKGK